MLGFVEAFLEVVRFVRCRATIRLGQHGTLSSTIETVLEHAFDCGRLGDCLLWDRRLLPAADICITEAFWKVDEDLRSLVHPKLTGFSGDLVVCLGVDVDVDTIGLLDRCLRDCTEEQLFLNGRKLIFQVGT